MKDEDRRKHVEKMKALLEKKGGKEVTWEEAEAAEQNLENFAHLLFDIWVKDKEREKRLAESPKGFSLEGEGYTCAICSGSTRWAGNWYDKWGIKCKVCQAAIDRGEIPPSLAKRKDGWYSEWELERAFNLKGTDLTKWIKNGIIKARVVTGETDRPHARLFLIKDNEGFLPPKKLVESRMVKEEQDGKTWFRSYEWYCFGDPKERLKGYKIMDHLRIIPPEEMKAREEEEKRRREERKEKRAAHKKIRKKPAR